MQVAYEVKTRPSKGMAFHTVVCTMGRIVRKLPIVAFVLLFHGSAGHAMSSLQFELIRPPSTLYEIIGGFWAINISGEISDDAGKRFVNFMGESGAPNRIDVYLDSPGGSVVGGIALGRELRARQMNTHVGKKIQLTQEDVATPDLIPGICFSACTLSYLGGYFRVIEKDSNFGVHRFYFQNLSPNNVDIAQVLSASIAQYVRDMGVDIAFMMLSARKAGTDLEIIPHEILRDLNVVNGGFTREEWSIQSIEGSLYVRGERDTYFGHQKLLLTYNPDKIQFDFTAVFEARNREEELNMMRQVDIECDSHMINVSSRSYRTEIINGYFIIAIPISINEARMIAASESAGVYMRFGPEAPTYLGISGMRVESGRHFLTGLINAYAR